MTDTNKTILPEAGDLARAIRMYLEHAYPDGVPEHLTEKFRFDDTSDVAAWLMSDIAERDPSNKTPLEDVRSFALRMGNHAYPNMKLRLTKPPRQGILLFSVDSHDAFLVAPPGSPDYEALEELKQKNAKVVSAITEVWDNSGILTERTYLRQKIEEARQRNQ